MSKIQYIRMIVELLKAMDSDKVGNVYYLILGMSGKVV